jgi:heptosyltransferase-3
MTGEALAPSVPLVTPRSEISRVLIYRLGSLGDNIVALPCYRRIAAAFPNAERRLLTNIPINATAPAAAAVLGDSGLIHDYIEYPVGMRDFQEILSLRAAIRRFRPQVLIYLSSLRGYRAAKRDRLFFRLCGIPELIGFPESMRDCERRRLPEGDLEPEASRLAHSIRSLGPLDLDDPSAWDLRLNEAERNRARDVLQQFQDAPFLAVSLGTKAQANDWGEANWTALLSRLAAALPNHRLALVGAAEETDACARAADAFSGRSLNLCGALAPRESAALLQSAQLFIGHDSGPMHLAAAAGAPCVAVFSARNLPRVWFPYGKRHTVIYHRTDCAGCELVTCIELQKKCIRSIAVDEVFEAVLAQLGLGEKRDMRPFATRIAP